MITRFSHGLLLWAALLSLLCLLVGCGTTVTVVVAPTATVPLATSTPAPGVCNPTDFPTKTLGGPPNSGPLPDLPAVGFQYPPLTYYQHITDATGTYYYYLCSSGTPSSILAFLKHAIPSGGWTITETSATTLSAVHTNAPLNGLCAPVDITVGSHAGYPGEWDATFQYPRYACTSS